MAFDKLSVIALPHFLLSFAKNLKAPDILPSNKQSVNLFNVFIAPTILVCIESYICLAPVWTLDTNNNIWPVTVFSIFSIVLYTPLPFLMLLYSLSISLGEVLTNARKPDNAYIPAILLAA